MADSPAAGGEKPAKPPKADQTKTNDKPQKTQTAVLPGPTPATSLTQRSSSTESLTVTLSTQSLAVAPSTRESLAPTSIPSSSPQSTNLALVTGGIVGGIFGLLALVFLFWFARQGKMRTRHSASFKTTVPRGAMASAHEYRRASAYNLRKPPSVPLIHVTPPEPSGHEYNLYEEHHLSAQNSWETGMSS